MSASDGATAVNRPVITMRVVTVGLSAAAVALAVAPSPAVRRIPVMTAGATAYGCRSPGPCKYAAFRIPGFINMNGTLLAVAEGRKFGCGDFDGQHDLVAARSTDDGETWSNITVLFDANFSWPASEFHSAHSNAIWDPTPVFDRTTGETFLFFAGPGRTAVDSRLDITMISSKDFGLSWGVPVNISSSCMRPGANPKFDGGLSGNTPADGCGMQVSTGRLVIPMYGAWSSTCYSDDHGKTWQHSKEILGGILATEGEITELFPLTGSAADAPPTLYFTIRNDKPTLPRQFATSTDGGDSWSNLTGLTEVRDPDCKGGITRWVSGRALVLSHSDSCTARVNTTVRLSTDNGRTFPFAQLIDPTSGYSTAQMIGPTQDTIGVLYEAGGCSLVLGKVEAADVLAHGRVPPAPPAPPPVQPVPVIRPGTTRVAVNLAPPIQLGNTTADPPCFLRPLLLGNGESLALQMSTSLAAPHTAVFLDTPRIQPQFGKSHKWGVAVPVAAGAPTIELGLVARETTLELANGLTVLLNGTLHGPILYISAHPLNDPLTNWTTVDLARHHDVEAAGKWWAGKWQFHSTQEPRAQGVCAGGGGPVGQPLCTSTGVATMAATGSDSVLVCYDQRYCPFEPASSGVWCVDIGIGIAG